MLGKLWGCLCKASCGCFLSGPTYLDPFTPLGPSFARFNNECRANQLSRKCTAVEESNPSFYPSQWAVALQRTLGKGFARIHTVPSKEVSSSIVPKQVSFINTCLPGDSPHLRGRSASPGRPAHGSQC